ncbi:hypothetical protein PIROE2DRAFT_16931 [Piromyces sp. E2]|nr:hypothetical protein PIROE2DRAFT_16931 [Piromyces sp. E2]|eukprot:OUM57935.1 hypothetical protein PIROE2DRAFT_16931 [Piromyces sp. E2]
METDDDFLLNIKKCKIYENSDNTYKSKNKLYINDKKINCSSIIWKKKSENRKSTVKKRRKRKGKKKKSSSVNKYSIALDLYQKQLKQNYKTLSSIQDRSKPSTGIDIIEDKYNIFNKIKSNSLNSLLPKSLSNYENRNSPSFIPIIAKRDDIQNLYSNSNTSNSNSLESQLNLKNNR